MLFRTNAIDDRVRQTLVQTLYTQPTSLAIGAAAGVITSFIAAQYAQRTAITATAVVLSAIAIVRVAGAVILPRLASRTSRRLEIAYEIGAFSYSLTIGLMAALTVHLGAPYAAQLLMVTNAIGYATGIAARNAGRPATGRGNETNEIIHNAEE